MTDAIRTEYRAIAVDPDDVIDAYEGDICSSAHDAHLSLSEKWEFGSERNVILKKRQVRESPWAEVDA